MAHWSDQFLGEPYVKGENDCASVAVRAVRAAIGREIHIPTERAGGWRGYSEQILAAKDGLALPVETPADGDGVLMVGRARLNHIGVMCLIGGERWVLHAMEAAGEVVRHRERDLAKFGLSIEGYYRWL
jgi:hypothetical protein